MAYRYYCTHCGKLLDQGTVLFDMAPLLTFGTQSDALNILKLHLTKAELEALVQNAEHLNDGYHRFQLTLGEMMRIIANSNNLNDPAIAGLSVQDILSFDTAAAIDLKNTAAPTVKTDLDVLFEMNDDEPDQPEPETVQQAAAPNRSLQRQFSEAVVALRRKDTKTDNEVNTEQQLAPDMEKLKRLFVSGSGETATEKAAVFEIQLQSEQADDRTGVLCGFRLRRNNSFKDVANARICPVCERKLFEHAGIAKHRLITFIGEPGSGKTCTILALAHYAESALKCEAFSENPIWGGIETRSAGNQPIESVGHIVPVSADANLVKELNECYEKGIAGEKTKDDSRERAYSATFLLKNKQSEGTYLITLIDLPGDLCIQNGVDDGKLKKEQILSMYPVALACDAFVLCFDTEKVSQSRGRDITKGNESTEAQPAEVFRGTVGAEKSVFRVCSWGNEFQQLRTQYKIQVEHENVPGLSKQNDRLDCVAPFMVLFTKCKELENGTPEQQRQNAQTPLNPNRIFDTYLFREERKKISENEIYRRVGEEMKYHPFLIKGYVSQIRCSPYGFNAPKQKDISEGSKSNQDKDGNIIYPRPKNIGLLMRWILSVSGCIPTDAFYVPDPSNISTVYHPSENYLTRPQYRKLIPYGDEKDGDLREALARCFLFENPGKYDRDFLVNYDRKGVLLVLRLTAKLPGADNVG